MKKKNIKIINFHKKEEYSYKRKVIITDLVFNTSIGIHDFEKEKEQQIKFNIEIDINPLLKASKNDLSNNDIFFDFSTKFFVIIALLNLDHVSIF